MSVYKPAKSPFYHYDFRYRGVRFSGSTERTGKAEARRVEAERRAEAEAEAARGQRRRHAPLTIGEAAARWWLEIGQHHRNADATWTDVVRLTDYFGPDRILATIDDDAVSALVAWRRAQHVPRRKVATFVKPATVNRTTIEPLQKIINRAVGVWKVPLPDAPTWRRHLLAEPQERVREVRLTEEAGLRTLPAGYDKVAAFARASGLRLASCLLRKDQVDLAGGRVHTIGKGGKAISQPITTEMRAILMEAMANPTTAVFTAPARRAKRGSGFFARGDARSITISGWKTEWRRHRAAGELPADLRIHDLRHDFATKLLRETGNLKLVQRSLHHAKIETTTRYAHVLDEEILDGMEAASRARLKG